MNPFTGEVVKVENSKWEFFNLVVMLHCSLLLGHVGTQIITWSTIIFDHADHRYPPHFRFFNLESQKKKQTRKSSSQYR
ncbi:hypothetical protein [Pedobacter sp. WC2423]|uniref:hypothetical protein n=1 Tax=Pedobacter sp. WC2423 TaxID=3234142 RepID=UPI003467493B